MNTVDTTDEGMSPVYLVRNLNTALELLDALSPWHEQWRSTGGVQHWLFRGQRQAGWRLSPSAMRPDAFPVWQPSSPTHYTAQPGDQKGAESRAVEQFIAGCNDSATPIPEDSQWLRSEAIESFWRNEASSIFPPALHRSIYALAQHHGVPTRLLDWSRKPLVAAYFACAQVAEALARVKMTAPTDRAAVFALRSPLVFSRLAEHGDPELVEVTAPYDANPNLRAQSGTFTLVIYRKGEPPERLPTIEDLIRAWIDRFPDAPPAATDLMLVKFTFPHSECGRLLHLLSHANVHAGTIYPGYDGVVRALNERVWHR